MNDIITEKLILLTEGAKYDVSCSSSGSQRKGQRGLVGDTKLPGICHSWAADGRCVSLLKVLLSNACIYNCAYCVNRASADFKRVAFEPKELVDITMNFYKRNYIEGLFISSAVFKSPQHTMEQMIEVIKRLRVQEGYNGYIHLKGIPGADQKQLDEAGKYADRMSINLELPTEKSLRLLAPEKKQETMFLPMNYLKQKHQENKIDLKKYSFAKPFMPAGQTTQMMIGASKDSDYSILRLSEAMYGNMAMKRVYYSAYVPVVENNSLLPTTVSSPLLREHRLYQADWLLRFYGFKAGDILSEKSNQLDLEMDPKCHWALRHMEFFPIEINKASFEWLIRIPGIGHTSAQKICHARRFGSLTYENLKKMGVVLKRAQYFILVGGKYYGQIDCQPDLIRNQIIRVDPKAKNINLNQITLDQVYPNLFWRYVMIVYLFDGSFEGFLSAIYDSYYRDHKPDTIYVEADYQPRLEDQIFRIISDSEKSQRVHQGILDKLGHEFYTQVIQAFLSEDLKGPSCIYYLVKKAFKEGAEIIFDLRDPQILKFKKLRTSVVRENHLLLGLVRFVVLKNDIYYAEIEPTYDQLPLLGDHFSQRMMNQRWVIHDLKRQRGLFYDKSAWYIQPIERTLNLDLSEDEKMYQSLWKTFHKHVAIEARKSLKRQQAFIPNKYWKHLIEEKAKK